MDRWYRQDSSLVEHLTSDVGVTGLITGHISFKLYVHSSNPCYIFATIGLQPLEVSNSFWLNYSGPAKRPLIRKRDYTPIHWDKYFERMHDVKCGDSDVSSNEMKYSNILTWFLDGYSLKIYWYFFTKKGFLSCYSNIFIYCAIQKLAIFQ